MMEGKTSFNKQKYRLNCLLVTEQNEFAKDTQAKAEALGLEVKVKVNSLEEVKNSLSNHSIDIILSDEFLDDVHCVNDLYSSIDKLPPLILFSGLDSKEVFEDKKINNSFVKLCKPFNQQGLSVAVRNSLKDRIQSIKQSSDIKKVEDVLYVRSSGKLISLDMNEIKYIKAEGNYCTIHVESKRIVIRSSISNVLEEINNPNFVQIHRGYIANIQFSNSLTIRNGNLQVGSEKLPIGRKYKKELMSIKKGYIQSELLAKKEVL